MTKKPRLDGERLPFRISTTTHTVTLSRHHGGADGSRLIRIPEELTMHLGDPLLVSLTPQQDGGLQVDPVHSSAGEVEDAPA